MQITKCLHTAILVSNLKKAEHFYSTILGLSKVDRVLKYPGIWYQIGEHQIHLIVDENFSKSLSNAEKWGQNPHFSLAVDNLGQATAHLQASGYPIQMSTSGRAALFTQDPDGNIIEISQL